MRMCRTVALATAIGSAGFATSEALAQISPTYVARSGLDTNDCTSGSPCRTVDRALEALLPFGRVIALDNISLARFTVSKSAIIDLTATHNQVFTSSSVIINGAAIEVVLKGFAIDQSANDDIIPISFNAGAHLVLEDMMIRSYSQPAVVFSAPNASLTLNRVSIIGASQTNTDTTGLAVNSSNDAKRLSIEGSLIDRAERGISVKGTGNVQLTLSNTTISNATGDGIFVNPSSGTTRLAIQNSKVVNNGGTGLLIAPTGAAKVNTTVMASGMDGNVIGIRSFPAGSAVSNVTISDTSASNNAGGIHASGKSVVSIIRAAIGGNSSYGVGAVSPAAVRIGSSVVSGNTLGFSGPISSYGNNQLHGNTNVGSTSPLPPGSVP